MKPAPKDPVHNVLSQAQEPVIDSAWLEQLALRRLRREVRQIRRSAWLFARRTIRLTFRVATALLKKVELVREVGPGLAPLPRDQWERPREERPPLY